MALLDAVFKLPPISLHEMTPSWSDHRTAISELLKTLKEKITFHKLAIRSFSKL